MSDFYQFELPAGFTLVPPKDDAPPYARFYEIRDSEATWGWIHESLAVKKILTPTPPPPTPATWTCIIDKVNVRLEPRATSADKGDVFKGQNVTVIQEIPSGNDLWGKIADGQYIALRIDTTWYFSKKNG